MINLRILVVLSSNVILFALTIFTACNNIHRNKTHGDISYASIKKGKELAQLYCQSCHQLPDPSLLDSKTWEKGVLPAMGPRLGIFFYNNTVYPSLRYDHNLGKNFYPAAPVLNFDQWQNIIDYYLAASPDTLISNPDKQASIANDLPGFKIVKPTIAYPEPATALVKVIGGDMHYGFVITDAVTHLLYRFDNTMQVMDSVGTKGPVVDLLISKNRKSIGCDIGILNPNNGKFGKAISISSNPGGKLVMDSIPLFDFLQRPVQLVATDVNNDSKTDYVVCEFGSLTGALSWMENGGNNKFTRHIIKPSPGAIKASEYDYNHDGLPDLLVLFAQGEEGIFLFTNKGKGQFEQKEILSFPPAYGSSYFELADFNKDGYDDIIYTCGDNADYSPVLKPYHGVYIFINDGKNNFTKQYFFHINGCYKAIARDFDNDGDLDLATISFFADYTHNPNEGFIYFENEGNLIFRPSTTPLLQQGRWMTMDAGDINGDGSVDLILGNFSIGPTLMKPKHNWKSGPPFIILQNNLQKQ